MARHPMMRTADGLWQVEVISTRGGQSFRVRRLDELPAPGSSGWQSTGQLVRSIEEVRDLLGDAFGTLTELRDGRFDGGR